MRFTDLYKIAEALAEPPVGFDFLRDKVIARHGEVGDVLVYAVTYPSPNGQAHFRLGEPDRSSGYGEEFQVAEIRYCDSLELDEAERRFALTKELMHVFDTPEERVDTAEKFRKLLHEIQNEPLPQHSSQAYQSEIRARWMAVLLLCPKKLRDRFVAGYRSHDLADFDIAEAFRIPEWIVPDIMDDYYDEVHAELVDVDESAKAAE